MLPMIFGALGSFSILALSIVLGRRLAPKPVPPSITDMLTRGKVIEFPKRGRR